MKDKFKFFINKQQYEVAEQNQTGLKLKNLAEISADTELYLKLNTNDGDKLVGNNDVVDLGLPGTEHFYTQSVNTGVVIIVSGEPKSWNKPTITFEEVIILAYDSYNNSPTMVYTVGYEDGPQQNVEGSMIKGQVVFVKDKMIFHATATDRS